jgi:hypothetical protein
MEVIRGDRDYPELAGTSTEEFIELVSNLCSNFEDGNLFIDHFTVYLCMVIIFQIHVFVIDT